VETPIESLIKRADQADPAAADELFATLYRELHAIAERTLRRGGRAITMGPTTLLHEAYLNITGREALVFSDHARFLSYASHAMRGLIIDYARRRRARKRGRHLEITLDFDESPPDEAIRMTDDLQQLSDALDELAKDRPELAELVDLHFFCGFSFGEIATLRNVSERTVYRDWRKARMLLHLGLIDDDA
jgi:RNA polymerase sigma factor (TIGR02999 family)